MSIKNKTGIGTLLLAMLLVYTVLVPAVSAQENSKPSEKPSELQQSLIDALNSNPKNLSTDDIVSNYCKANKDEISRNSFVSNNSSSYKLKDGSKITFTKQGHILINSLKVINNTTKSTNEKNEMTATSLVNPRYTRTLESNVTEYNLLGWKLFSVYSQGYFGYDHVNVEPHLTNSWYEKNMDFNLWQVSNWENGEQIVPGNIGEIYTKGNFHYGFEYNGNSLTVQNYYVKVYLSCDRNGNYGVHYSVTELVPKLKIGSRNIEF